MPCSGEESGDTSRPVNGYGFLEESTKNVNMSFTAGINFSFPQYF